MSQEANNPPRENRESGNHPKHAPQAHAEGQPKNKNVKHAHRKINPETGIRPIPVDIVDVERSILEKWILSLKHYSNKHAATARYIILATGAAALLAVVVMFVHSFAVENHSTRFYRLVKAYEESSFFPEDTKKKTLSNIASDAGRLCNVFWKTTESSNACLLSAIAARETGDNALSAKSLQAYGNQSGKNLKGFAAFYAGYSAEFNKDIDGALAWYTKMQPWYKKMDREDFPLFHQARMHYHKKDSDKALALFEQIETEYPDSPYAKEAKKYRLLILSQKNTNG